MPVTMTVDGNTAVSRAAYAFSEYAAIYPITPSSSMAELADEWAAQGRKNLFGQPMRVTEMQSEAGAAGAVHGALTAGALSCTFTASQGLLLMIPNMYKMAGELLPAVFHVSARALSCHALSIFGDQSDVMACRQTGFAMLCSGSVQEAGDLAVVAHMAALEASVPFLHFFDGFRTSHEIQRVSLLDDAEMATLMPWDKVKEFRCRALNPDHPTQSGTAQNPDIYFQNREAGNPYYIRTPALVQACMDRAAAITGRRYRLFDYAGAEDAQRVIVLMGSGGETAEETAAWLNARGEKVGVLKVRLYRPFDADAFAAALPRTAERIAVLDRTKEPGSLGEPLYLDVCAALRQTGRTVTVIGGRYGLGGKDFTPRQVRAVFDGLKGAMPHGFTVGIDDDVTDTSLPLPPPFDPIPQGNVTCKFFGLGSDGTVGACKRTVKLLGERTELNVQAYFAYDSRKSGGLTVSHLRYGRHPIHSAYLAGSADLVSCQHPAHARLREVADSLREGGVFLLNAPWTEEALAHELPPYLRRALAEKHVRLFLIDARRLAESVGLGQRISTIMQAAFFRVMDIFPYEQAMPLLKEAAAQAFARQGEDVIRRNEEAITLAAEHLREITVPESWRHAQDEPEDPDEDGYYQRYIRPILEQQGDRLPVSMMNPRGLTPTGTTKYEKRGIAAMTPEWVPERCIQCAQCALVCPHAVIRPFYMAEGTEAPEAFATIPAKGKEYAGKRYRIQVSPLDCTGCSNCAEVCPAPGKALVMRPLAQTQAQAACWDYAMTLPETLPDNRATVKNSQAVKPLFEFSGACAGCGETPYIKLLTQLFGERMLIANATGCSSIYGGSSPTCPYTVNGEGRGPAWANSLFEDNAEFGFGMLQAVRQRRERLAGMVRALAEDADADEALRDACQAWLDGMEDAAASGASGRELAALCRDREHPLAREIAESADLLEKKSLWLLGGDGWAYDIGFGGLDHVLAQGADINVLVLDTEVYSNTGGQASKATPAGAMAKFAVSGKQTGKKDLGIMAMTYGHVYVASVSMGANQAQLVKALAEAESYPGPSLVIAYAPCINHGVNLRHTQAEMRRAVESGYWPLYRYDPRKEAPLTVDGPAPKAAYQDFIQGETRFTALARRSPEEAAALFQRGEEDAARRREVLKRLAGKADETRQPSTSM